jgi:hypothetical protein
MPSTTYLLSEYKVTSHGGTQFHTVIGGIRFIAGHFFLVAAHSQEYTPATGARITLAGAIRENLYMPHEIVRIPSNPVQAKA